MYFHILKLSGGRELENYCSVVAIHSPGSSWRIVIQIHIILFLDLYLSDTQ